MNASYSKFIYEVDILGMFGFMKMGGKWEVGSGGGKCGSVVRN